MEDATSSSTYDAKASSMVPFTDDNMAASTASSMDGAMASSM